MLCSTLASIWTRAWYISDGIFATYAEASSRSSAHRSIGRHRGNEGGQVVAEEADRERSDPGSAEDRDGAAGLVLVDAAKAGRADFVVDALGRLMHATVASQAQQRQLSEAWMTALAGRSAFILFRARPKDPRLWYHNGPTYPDEKLCLRLSADDAYYVLLKDWYTIAGGHHRSGELVEWCAYTGCGLRWAQAPVPQRLRWTGRARRDTMTSVRGSCRRRGRLRGRRNLRRSSGCSCPPGRLWKPYRGTGRSW